MTTRRFLFVDTTLTAPPSPTGLPEGYAVITKDGKMFIIKGGVFKATSGPGTIIGVGLPPTVDPPLAPAYFFNTTTTTKPAAYQSDDNSGGDVQTYGETANPAPPATKVGYTAITPPSGPNGRTTFHVIYLTGALPLGGALKFLYRFDPGTEGADLDNELALRFEDNHGAKIFAAAGTSYPTGGDTVSNEAEWKSAEVYIEPGTTSLYFYCQNTSDGETSAGRILLTDVCVHPFDVQDQGTGWYDDTSGEQYLYDNGWRAIRTPAEKHQLELDSYKYSGEYAYKLSADTVLANASTTLAAPTLNTITESYGGNLIPNQAYYWKITTLSAYGESLPSAEQTFTPTNDGQHSASLSWTSVAGAAGYRIYRGTTPGGEDTFVSETDAATTSFTDAGTGSAATLPSSDTTAGSTPDWRFIPEIQNTGNDYQQYVIPASYQNVGAAISNAATLTVKHAGTNPDIYLQLVAFNRFLGTYTVMAEGVTEDLVSGKYRTITLSGNFRPPGQSYIDFYVRYKSTVPGAITVRAKSNLATSESVS